MPSLHGRLEETTDEKVSDATQTAFATPLSVTSTMCVWTTIGLLVAFLLFFVLNAIFGLGFMHTFYPIEIHQQ